VVVDDHATTAVATRLGAQVADLITGVEGHAQLLCESIGDPPRVAAQAAELWRAVRKLRLFGEKLSLSSPPKPIACQPTDVRALLVQLHGEIETLVGGGMPVRFRAAWALPRATADADALAKAVLFLVDAVLELEPRASSLALSASTIMDHDAAPAIEVRVEAESDDQCDHGAQLPLPLGHTAAHNLIAGFGGELEIDHVPGLRATATIYLSAAFAAVPEPPAPIGPPAAEHPFGGVLVLESSPDVRSVIQRELSRVGHRVVCCADEAAARSLFAATPDRFELLILEGGVGDALTLELSRTHPDVALLRLTDDRSGVVQGVAELPKPFGITEFREAVGRTLGERRGLAGTTRAYSQCAFTNHPG